MMGYTLNGTQEHYKKPILPDSLEGSNVALGVMDFGTTTSKENTFAVLDAYLDMGSNFVDSSNNYAHADEPTAPPEETTEECRRIPT